MQVAHSPYVGMAHCIRVMLREEGVGAFFKSLRTTVRAFLGVCRARYVSADTRRKVSSNSCIAAASGLRCSRSPTQILMNVPFTAIHFSTYEAGKRALGEAGQPEGLRSELLAGGLAGAQLLAGASCSSSAEASCSTMQLRSSALPLHTWSNSAC